MYKKYLDWITSVYSKMAAHNPIISLMDWREQHQQIQLYFKCLNGFRLFFEWSDQALFKATDRNASRVRVVNREERIPMVDRELCEDNASTKTISMEADIVSKDCIKALELLDALVSCFMSTPYAASNIQLSIIMVVNNAFWNFGNGRIFTNVAIVSFHSFKLVKPVLETESEDVNVRPVSTRERAHHRHDITSEDACC